MSETAVHAPKGDVKLPGLGPVPKKWFLIVGGGSVIVIGYIVIKKRSAAASSPAAAATTAGTSALSGQPCTDENGNPGVYDDTGTCQTDTDALGGYYAGDGAAGVSGVTAPVPGTGGFTTNGQWTQQAEADMSATGGDPATLSAALGAYITGQPLTAAQQSLVDSAIAEEGYPPVAGASGYPPAMHSTSTSTTGTPPTTKASAMAGPLSNLTSSKVTQSSFTVSWNADTGNTGGYKYALTELAGTAVHSGTTKATSVSLTGLKADTTYNFGIQGLPGGAGDNIHVKTLAAPAPAKKAAAVPAEKAAAAAPAEKAAAPGPVAKIVAWIAAPAKPKAKAPASTGYDLSPGAIGGSVKKAAPKPAPDDIPPAGWTPA